VRFGSCLFRLWYSGRNDGAAIFQLVRVLSQHESLSTLVKSDDVHPQYSMLTLRGTRWLSFVRAQQEEISSGEGTQRDPEGQQSSGYCIIECHCSSGDHSEWTCQNTGSGTVSDEASPFTGECCPHCVRSNRVQLTLRA